MICSLTTAYCWSNIHFRLFRLNKISPSIGYQLQFDGIYRLKSLWMVPNSEDKNISESNCSTIIERNMGFMTKISIKNDSGSAHQLFGHTKLVEVTLQSNNSSDYIGVEETMARLLFDSLYDKEILSQSIHQKLEDSQIVFLVPITHQHYTSTNSNSSDNLSNSTKTISVASFFAIEEVQDAMNRELMDESSLVILLSEIGISVPSADSFVDPFLMVSKERMTVEQFVEALKLINQISIASISSVPNYFANTEDLAIFFEGEIKTEPYDFEKIDLYGEISDEDESEPPISDATS